MISIYTICHSQQSDQGLHYFPFFYGLHYSPFSAVWSVYTISHSQQSHQGQGPHCHFQEQSDQTLWNTLCISQQSDQGQGSRSSWEQSDQDLLFLLFSAIWSWSTLLPILFKQYYQGLHCLPFFLSSFIKVCTVGDFQLSDHGLHYLSFSAVSSRYTLFSILSKQYHKIYTVRHSEQSDQGLHYLPFSAVWSAPTLFSILSSLISVYTICYSQSDQRLNFLPFPAVWSGSTQFPILF